MHIIYHLSIIHYSLTTIALETENGQKFSTKKKNWDCAVTFSLILTLNEYFIVLF